jgi:bacterial/archaeal transporter family-2 protein
MIYFYIFLAILVGVSFASQSLLASKYSLSINNAIISTFISLLVSTILVLFLQFGSFKANYHIIRSAPLWAYYSGVFGAFAIVTLIYLIPKLGISLALIFMISAQLITAVIFDHFGLLGVQDKAINIQKLVGIFLVIGGCVICLRA